MPSAPGAPAADVAAALLAGALHAASPADEGRAALDVLRRAVPSDRAILARAIERWSRPVVRHQSPAGDRPDAPIDLDTLGAVFDADGPIDIPADGDGPPVLAIALRPRDDVPWCVALARVGGEPWSASDRDALKSAAPALTLLLEHALYRQSSASDGATGEPAAAMRGRFLSLLSHELRNPLAPILMWTSTLRRLRRDDAEVQRASQAIEHAVGLARSLIEEVSEVSRLERGLLEVQCRPFDLRDPVRSAVEQARTTLEAKDLKVLAEIPDEPVPAHGDATRLKQVVGHLLANAAKFGTPGGIVTIQVIRDDGRATLRVSDTGPGLPAVLLPQLFTPFVQGPNARGGLGVGLAISQRLLALQNGSIEAVPADGEGGATFVVRLPRPAS